MVRPWQGWSLGGVRQGEVGGQGGALFLIFWLLGAVCGISVPRPGIEPVPPAVEAQSLNHGITREVQKGTLWRVKQTLFYHHMGVCESLGDAHFRASSKGPLTSASLMLVPRAGKDHVPPHQYTQGPLVSRDYFAAPKDCVTIFKGTLTLLF